MGVAVGLLVAPLGSVEIVGGGVECSVRDPVNGITVRVKQLAALFALLISVPALIGAVGVLRRDGGEGVVSTGSCLDLNGAGGRFCSCLCGNDRFTGGYGGHLARGVDGSNIDLARRPYHRVGRTFRCDRRCQGVTITGSQRQFSLVKSDTGCRLRCGSDSNRRRFSCESNVIIIRVITIVRLNDKLNFQTTCCTVINFTLKCHKFSRSC